MRTFKSVSGWLLTGSLLVLLALVGLIAVGRFIYPTAAQREAVAELERGPSYEGKNAAALLWSLHYAVPMADLDRVFASDMARKEQIQQAFDEGLAPVSNPSAFAAHCFSAAGPAIRLRIAFLVLYDRASCVGPVAVENPTHTVAGNSGATHQ